MRKILVFLAGGAIALAIAAHYAHWHLTGHAGPRSDHAGSAAPAGHGTCGIVANVYHDTRDAGQPTFVDLGHDYPNQDFTIVIWQRDLDRFKPPPASWEGKRICVTGHVKTYKGRPEIIAYGPGQIRPDN